MIPPRGKSLFDDYYRAYKLKLDMEEEQVKRLEHLEAELSDYREVVALFLGKYFDDVDNITSEDLEWGLIKFQEDAEQRNKTPLDTTKYIGESYDAIYTLCAKLGLEIKSNSYTEAQQIKIFIKELVRDKVRLESELKKQRDWTEEYIRIGEEKTRKTWTGLKY